MLDVITLKALLITATKFQITHTSHVKDLIAATKEDLQDEHLNLEEEKSLREKLSLLQTFSAALEDLNEKDYEKFNSRLNSYQDTIQNNELQKQIDNLISALSLEENFDIEEQIKFSEDDLNKAKQRGRQDKIDEETERLEALDELRSLIERKKTLEELFQDNDEQTDNLCDNIQNEQAELQKQIDALASELSLEENFDIVEQIMFSEDDLNKAKQRGRQDKIDEESNRLDALIRLRDIIKRKNDSERSNDAVAQQVSNIQEKERVLDQIAELISKLCLDKNVDIEKEIEFTEDDLKTAKERGRQDKIDEETERLESLKKLKELQETFKELNKEQEEKKMLENLKNEINILLNDLNIDKNDDIDEQIEFSEDDLQSAKKRRRQDKVDEETKRLANLKKLKELKEKYSELNRENKLKEQLEKIKIEKAALIEELKLPEDFDIKQQMDYAQDDLSSAKRRKDQKKIEIEKARLERLQKLTDLINQENALDNSTFPSFQQNYQYDLKLNIRKEIDDLISNLALEDNFNIDEQIEFTEDDLKSATRKGRQDKIDEETERLESLKKLKELQETFKELNKEQEEKKMLENLKNEINSLLKGLNIDESDDIDEQIEFTEDDLKSASRKGRQDKVDEETKRLANLKKLKELKEKYRELNKENELKEHLEKIQLKKVELIEELKLPEDFNIEQQIYFTKDDLSNATEKGRTHIVDENKERLQKLIDLQQLILDEESTVKPNVDEENIEVEEEIYNITQDLKSAVESGNQQKVDHYTTELQNLQNQVNLACEAEVETLKEFPEVIEVERKDNCRVYSIEEINCIPDCAEKTVLSIIIDAQNSVDINENIFDTLFNQIKEEGLGSNSVISESIFSARASISDRTVFLQSMRKLIKQLRPVDFSEIEFLVNKAKEAGIKIDGKEIILLLGATGAGKSTTILYLAGQKLAKTNNHVGPVGNLKYPDLKQVISSNSAASETRYVHPVVIPLADLVPGETGFIIYCDAPGFEDTSGPEVDIANSIGVIEAIGKCKSVKLLALSNYEGIGERGQGIQKLAHIIGNMISNIDDRLSSITYGFTKYPTDWSISDINAKVANLKKSKVDEDPFLSSDTAFVSVLKDIIFKTSDTRNQHCIIDALDGNPQNLTKLLLNSTPIKNPDEAFVFSLSDASNKALESHAQTRVLAIANACKNQKLDLVKYYLDCFSKMIKLLPDQQVISDAFQKSVQYVADYMKKCFNIAKEKLDLVLRSSEGIEEQHIKGYFETYNTFVKMKKLSAELSDIPTGEFVSHVRKELQERTKDITDRLPNKSDFLENESHQSLENEDESEESTFVRDTPNFGVLSENSTLSHLNNCKLISSYFPEIKVEYFAIKRAVTTSIDYLVEITQNSIQESAFVTFSSCISALHKCEKLIQAHSPKNKNVVSLTIDNLEKKLQRIIEDDIKTHFASQHLFIASINSIKDGFTKISDAYNNRMIRNILLDIKPGNTTIIDIIYNNLMNEFENYFTKISNSAKSKFDSNEKNAFQMVKGYINTMKNLRTNIPEIYGKTNSHYNSVRDSLTSYTEKIKGDAEDVLLSFQGIDSSIEPKEIKNITRSLQKLKQASAWIDDMLGEGTYKNIIEQIKGDIIAYAEKLVSQVQSMEINLSACSDMEDYVMYMEKFQLVMPLESIFPELIEERKRAQDTFADNVVKELALINKNFNLRVRDIQTKIDKLQSLERLKAEIIDCDIALSEYNKEFGETLSNKLKARKNIDQKIANEKEKFDLEQEKIKSTVADLKTRVEDARKAKKFSLPSFFSKSELEVKIKNLEDLIKENEDNSFILQKDFNDIKNKYLAIGDKLSNPELNDEQKTKLINSKFNSMEALEEDIKNLSSSINSMRAKKMNFEFPPNYKFYTQKAVIAVKFVKACTKVRRGCVHNLSPSFHDNLEDTKEKLKQYLDEYFEHSWGVIEECYQKIITSYDKCTNEGEILYKKLKEQKEIIDKSEITTFLEGGSGEDCATKFSNFKLNYMAKQQASKSLDLSIDDDTPVFIGDLLRMTDNILLDSSEYECKFSTLGDKIREEKRKQFNGNYRELLEAIDRSNFKNVQNYLIKIGDPIPEKQKKQIQLDLQANLKKLKDYVFVKLRGLSSKIMYHDFESQEAEIDKITEKIDILNGSLNFGAIIDILDPEFYEQQLKKFSTELDAQLEKIFTSALDATATHIESADFFESEMALTNIFGFYNHFETILTPEKNAEFAEKRQKLQNNLEEKLKARCSDDILKNFNNYPTNQIDVLIESLTKVSEKKKNYGKFLRVVTQTVSNTVKLEIEKIRNESNFKEREKLLRIFKYNIDVLPQKLKDNFKSQIDQVETFIKQDYSLANEDIASVLEKTGNSKESFQEINERISRYKEKDPSLVTKLENAVASKFDKLLESIENLKSYSYQSISSKFGALNDYFATFGFDELDRSSALIRRILQRFINDIFVQNENEARALEILHQLLDNNGGFAPLSKIMNEEDFNGIVNGFYSAKKKIISNCGALIEKFENNVVEKHDFSHLHEIFSFLTKHAPLVNYVHKIQLLKPNYKHSRKYSIDSEIKNSPKLDTLKNSGTPPKKKKKFDHSYNSKNNPKNNNNNSKNNSNNSKNNPKNNTRKNVKGSPLRPRSIRDLNEFEETFTIDNYTNELKRIHGYLVNILTSFMLVKDRKYFYASECSAYYKETSTTYNEFACLEQAAVDLSLDKIIPAKDKVDSHFLEECKVELDKLKSSLNDIINTQSEKNCDTFRVVYNHLELFNKIFPTFKNVIDVEFSTIEQNVIAHFEAKNSNIKKDTSIPEIAEILTNMKFYAVNLSIFNNQITQIIDKALKKVKTDVGSKGISQLSANLEKSDLGCQLIQEHTALVCEDWRRRREKMQEQDNIDKALENLDGTNLDKKVLRKRFDEFLEIYQNILRDSMSVTNENSANFISNLVRSTRTKANNMATDVSKWGANIKDNIADLLAHIFAIWTISSSEEHNESRGVDESSAFLLRPHVCQVLSIFRMLGIGYSTNISGIKSSISRMVGIGGTTPMMGLSNNLIEIGTGEGKSVVLAVASCIFALLGFEVNCSCYSEELSKRDKENFSYLFRSLKIEQRIHYGTFNQLCEDLLNERCNIRETILQSLQENTLKLENLGKKTKFLDKILLIDEVDVFLSEKYYGGAYTPSVKWFNNEIFALLQHIWTTKPRTLKTIQSSQTYKNCISKYSAFAKLFEEAIKDLLATVNGDITNPYEIIDDKIQYLDGESYSSAIFHGYETVWAYFMENEKGTISKESLMSNVGILYNCGVFSFAEMPHDFKFIAGVSGTLKTLATKEHEILRDVYGIQQMTYAPSVFKTGTRKIMAPKITNSTNDYFDALESEILTAVNSNRAVLVFFTDESKINAFYKDRLEKNKKGISIDSIQIVTERLSSSDRKLFIKRASTPRKVSLFTRTFGRGTDFMVNNQDLITAGGILVVHCFYSEEASEEKQIQGRCARQGDPGTYKPVYLANDLDWLLGSNWDEEIKKIQSESDPRIILNAKRDKLYNAACESRGLGIKQLAEYHNQSISFLRTLIQNGKIELDFLLQQNKGAEVSRDICKTIVLVDGTSSMGSLLEACKNTVCTMFERANAVLKENGFSEDIFQLKFVVYRDYDCKEEILQASTWQSNPSNLRNFLMSIKPKGGGDYEEAVEIGLQYCVKQQEAEGISQIILIADAPAKEESAISSYRETYGGEAYWTERFGPATHWQTEAAKLKGSDIPIHSFYLYSGAKYNLQKIADAGGEGGKCVPLDINSSNGSATLTDLVTQQILFSSGESEEQGEKLVAEYKKMFSKTYV